jgi:demethylmenaquinone methyltransferase/2-methoxy-6-polyprenyl-1,4-benzoquinol methylase
MAERLPVRDRIDLPNRRFVAELFQGFAPRYNGVLLAYSLAQDLRWKEVLVRRLRPERGERALDLGCGTGLILDRLSNVLGESDAVGADINRTMLLQVLHTGASPPLVQANVERLPFASQAFDIVTAGYLLKYVQLDRLFLEVARVLRPGGRFGGYDFSRPIRGTPIGTLYSIYLHRILPWIGRGRGRQRGAWRSVFEFLPQIVESSGWESRVLDALERAGFVGVEVVPSLGGAITWVWARKGPMAEGSIRAR